MTLSDISNVNNFYVSLLKISAKRVAIHLCVLIIDREAHRRETRKAVRHEKQENDSGRREEGR